MKILAISGKNIASLEEFNVDFREEPLKSAGIFSIVGPTGSGKSSLLDAMCLALYNKAPRLDDVSNQSESMQTSLGEFAQNNIAHLVRRGSSECSARVVFLGVDGEEYCASWGYRLPKRANSKPQEEVSLVCVTKENAVVTTKKSECNSQIESLIGLTYNQFTRTIFLAQGRFSEFLKSNKSERAGLLEKLTGTEIYTLISKNIHIKYTQEKKDLDGLNDRLARFQLLTDEERAQYEEELTQIKTSIFNKKAEIDTLRSLKEVCELQDRLLKNQAELQNKKMANDQLKNDLEKFVLIDEKVYSDFSESLKVQEPQITAAQKLDSEIMLAQSEYTQKEQMQTQQKSQLASLKGQLEIKKTELLKVQQDLKKCDIWYSENVIYKPIFDEWTLCEFQLNQYVNETKIKAQTQKDFEAYQSKLDGLKRDILNLVEKQVLLNETLQNEDQKSLHLSRDEIHLQISEIQNLKQYFKIQALVANLESQILNAETRLGLAQEQIIPAQDQLNQTQNAYDIAQKMALENVEALRKSLVNGEKCPVCGSLEHPATESHQDFKALLSVQKELLDASQKKVQELQKEISTTQASLSIYKSDLEQNQRDLKTISLVQSELFTQTQAQFLEDQSVESFLNSKKSEFEIEQVRINELLLKYDELQQINSRLSEERIREKSMQNEQEQIQIKLTEKTALLKTCEENLSQIFGTISWKDQAHLAEFTAKWKALKEKFLSCIEAQAKFTLALTDVQSQIQSLETQVVPLENLIESSELALGAHLQILISLKDQRKAYFEGKSVEVLRKENQIQLEKLQSQAQKSLQKMNENKEFLAGIVAQIEQVEQNLLEQKQKKFEFELKLGLSSEDSVDLQDWITKNWLLWNEDLQKSVDREAQIRAELNQNQLQTLEAQNLQKEVEAQSKIVFRWDKLNHEIGSGTGSAFKEIAQAFTLEILLEHANSQLKQMTNRYTLKQINESLMFGVIDRDFYDEERPVHTLSGGETFIVSLALALGLSAMTSAGLSIESLFIDEGFGTLDSETLKSVMMALSSLHSQGRKVGLITHVEEMKEQIPVSIVVQKVGQGKSRVEVIGS